MARYIKYALTFGLFFGCSLSCTGDYQAKINDVWIPQADSIQPLPQGENWIIDADGKAGKVPKSANVFMIAPREIPWHKIQSLRENIQSLGKTPFLVVGKRKKTGVFLPSDEIAKENGVATQAISAYVTPKGKFCVGPPKAIEYKCTQRSDKLHADRAGIRQLVREARKGYRLDSLNLNVDPMIGYADYIRAVDGARTCCSKLPDTKVFVNVTSVSKE